MKPKILIAILTLGVMVVACKKGDQGPAGQNGVANIKMTSVTVNPTDWIAGSTDNWYYYPSLVVPSSDVCEVYLTIPGAGNTSLPTVQLSYLNGGQLFFFYQTGVDVQLHLYNTAGTLPSNSLAFNIVDIPPAVQIKHPNTDWSNPVQVAKLPEVASVLHN